MALEGEQWRELTFLSQGHQLVHILKCFLFLAVLIHHKLHKGLCYFFKCFNKNLVLFFSVALNVYLVKLFFRNTSQIPGTKQCLTSLQNTFSAALNNVV